MFKKFLIFITLFSTLHILLHANDLEEAESAQLSELNQEPIFVSLGSVCEVAHILRACNIRKAAFPFDWITSIDSEKFLEILKQDFRYFLDENYLRIGNVGQLLNDFYHLEFLHEGDFRGDLYIPNLQNLKSKCTRRIERFRQLAEYPGKVIFVRTAYLYSTTDPHRYYFCSDNLEISDEYAWKLYHILREYFPTLDFTLIIINNNTESIIEEERLHHNLIKLKSNQTIETSIRMDAYKAYFNSIISKKPIENHYPPCNSNDGIPLSNDHTFLLL